jgi:FHA domain-containing protein/type VI secretion system protein
LLEDLAKQTPAAPGHDASIPPLDFAIPTPRGGPPPSASALEALLGEPSVPAASSPQPARAAPHVAAAAPAGSAGLDHFLAGLGIPRDALHIASDEETLELAGRIVRAAIESIIAFLLSRSVVKKELRAADRTMLASRDNNPLKVMENTDEALRFLFDTSEERRRAFKAPVPALQDACDDILAHEVALLAGCRAAVIAAFRRFDPALIEKQNEKGGLLGAINRRAQLWDGYVAQFEKTQAELSDQVERVLSRDFMKEYMIQVAKFKRDRPPRE